MEPVTQEQIQKQSATAQIPTTVKDESKEVSSIMESGIDLTKRDVVADAVMQSSLPVENTTEANVVADAIIMQSAKSQISRKQSPKEQNSTTKQETRADIKTDAIELAQKDIDQAVGILGQDRVDELVSMVETVETKQTLSWKPLDIKAYIDTVQPVKRPTQGRKD
jgi:hypothetical protein